MNAEITLITKLGPNPILTKKISLDETGTVRSDGSQCLLVHGTASRATVATAIELAQLIADCGSDQAIALGALRADISTPASTTTKSNLMNSPGSISRSREYIDYWPGQEAWILIDVDVKGMPPNVWASVEDKGGVWETLLAIVPGLARATRVSRASTSAGLFREDTGELFPGSGGAHYYILVKDGADAERFLRDLHDRCWLHGLGWHVIGQAGQLLERSLVDRMVGYGERLCFEGAPIITPPLAQDLGKRVPQAFEGEAIDTEVIVPKLTEYERQRVLDAKSASTEALGKEATGVRSRHDQILAAKISTKTGMPLVSSLRLVSARHRGVLLPHLEIEFDHLGTVSVADVLADPERFIGETLADPLEGIDYGPCKAKVMSSADGRLFIHSFAHGRGIYHLRHDPRSAKAAMEKAPAGSIVDLAMAILASAEMEADEHADFCATVAKSADVPVTAVKARARKERQERDKSQRLAAMASGDDTRIIRDRPRPDDELTPTVTFLDQLLASDPREEPPMRNASGHLVEVQVREPWALHLLTADGTNRSNEDSETMKAPAEPGLEQLTPVRVEMLLERHVRWKVETATSSYFCALPRPHIDALMQFSPSAIPVVRAINTAPLVSMSGSVIDGTGLDRDTGLFHLIDPLHRACLPAGTPTDQDGRDALTFLLDEWLVDVALDPVGKCIAIMLAMTLIERALLPERPAFFVTAGQRGGGKTTLVNMITLAVLGRRAAAAGWSDKDEERKKALFSYLRQGVACIAWDNIARGETISCPHIEAALTAPEISDRVLGVSHVEIAPAMTVHVFTGNSIMPRGDMASRSLLLTLNVDRPDPENRTFEHVDPMAWTQTNRSKILRALYTLLIAGALSRPKAQEAKTRFKTWWNLVGWPIEYAAGLLGITLDCTELMRAGEVGDEEASAASVALTVLKKIFAEKPFTSRDIVRAMTPDWTVGSRSILEEEKIAMAEALTEAMSELVGKHFQRPTAHSIGKLLQKRLVGRPARITDGEAVVTLRRIPGHSQNTYRVEMTAPNHAASANFNSSAEPGQKHSPLSPHSPHEHFDGTVSGKVGKVGKVIVASPDEATNNSNASNGYSRGI